MGGLAVARKPLYIFYYYSTMQTKPTQQTHIDRRDTATTPATTTSGKGKTEPGNTPRPHSDTKQVQQGKPETINRKIRHTEQHGNHTKQHERRRRRTYLARRTYEEGAKRQHVLSMKSGNRKLSMVSINPGNFTSHETKLAIRHIIRNKQDTHSVNPGNTHTK